MLHDAKQRIDWRPALAIWWAMSWREAVVAWLFEWLVRLVSKILYGDGDALADSFFFGSIIYVVDWCITLWAIRDALCDRYTTFRFDALSKATGLSLLQEQKRLGIHVVFAFWWACGWRLSIVPVALIVGSVGAAAALHKDIMETVALLTSPHTQSLVLLLMVPISLWVTREALSVHYRNFTFTVLHP